MSAREGWRDGERLVEGYGKGVGNKTGGREEGKVDGSYMLRYLSKLVYPQADISGDVSSSALYIVRGVTRLAWNI